MLKLINVGKKYKRNKDQYFYAVNSITYEFSETGFYFLYGKSGSGKSTLANLIASFEKPDEGHILYENIEINKLNQINLNYYRQKIVGMVFQHYNLIEDLTVLENVILPRKIIQDKQSNAIADAKKILDELNIRKLENKVCKNLSGGEKQRVAIARCLINNPKIIICDEPTGALDEKNSIQVIKLLKELSKKHLIIVISHNYDLIKIYADNILYLSDGKLKEKHNLHYNNSLKKFNFKNIRIRFFNFIKLSIKNLLSNKIKNILIFLSTSFCIFSSLIVLGFVNGSNDFLNKETYARFDYSFSSISKIDEIHIDNSFLKLNKMERLSHSELANLISPYPFISFGINYNKLLENSSIYIDNYKLVSYSLSFVYNFDCVNNELIIAGEMSATDGVYINESLDKKLQEKLNIKTSLGRYINIKLFNEFKFDLYDNGEQISDNFVFEKLYFIKGIVREFNFLTTPKIYLCYQDFDSNIKNISALNLSKYYSKNYTWFDYIYNSSGNEEQTSFSHYIFLNDLSKIKDFDTFVDSINSSDDIEISCDGYLLKNTFEDIVYAIKIGVFIFMILTMIGMVLIIGISSFSTFAFKKKQNAIFISLGMNIEQLFSIYILENFFTLLISLIFGFILSFIFQPIINKLIFNIFQLTDLINIPFLSVFDIPLFLPFIIVFFSFFITYFSTYSPIYFSKNINISKELKDE